MFHYKHTVTGDFDKQRVWNYYSDVSLWKEWDSEVEGVDINGEFANGSSGIIHMKNGQSLPFVLENVESASSFGTVSNLGPVRVTFEHFINDNAIVHTVTIEGGEEKQMEGMGKGITAHIPKSMEVLLSMAQK